MKNFLIMVLGVAMVSAAIIGAAHMVEARLVTVVGPPPVINVLPAPDLRPKLHPKWDKVIRLYDTSGHPVREYTGVFEKVEEAAGSVRFTKEDGRVVVLGGTFTVEEIPHQEAP